MRIHTFLISLVTVLILLGVSMPAKAQILGVPNQEEFTDSLKNEFLNAPYFGLYKDNYFTVGTTVGKKPDKHNSDVKFQLSIAQRLTKTTLPLNSYLFIAFSIKAMWNVFENSLPMRDLNFNPGLGWSFPFFSKGRYAGKFTFMIEHESNGRDGEESRSWNKISFAGSTLVNEWLMVHSKFWIPIVDGENNRDILKYSGIYQGGLAVTTPNQRFGWALTLVKRKGWNLNFNTILEFNWRIFPKDNEYFFVQYYNGFGECMLDYNKFHSRIRVGMVIKPKFFSEF
ncbi:MAG: phospholipase A [Bacteroidales bacterium]|nr:phospholipase A [Bacteroidales bacterium]MBD5288759.1 phospholipase A [Bacteroides sp.]